MKQITNYIIEKFKINSKNAKDIITFNPDDLNNDNQTLYDSEDQGEEEGDNEVFWEDFLEEVKQLNKKYWYYIAFKYHSMSKSKNYEKDILDYSEGLKDIIDSIITGKDLGYKVKLVGGHLEIDCINSGHRATYYIYALSQETYETLEAFFAGEEGIDNLNFLNNEKSILEIKL